jgi:hypothetical protein
MHSLPVGDISHTFDFRSLHRTAASCQAHDFFNDFASLISNSVRQLKLKFISNDSLLVSRSTRSLLVPAAPITISQPQPTPSLSSARATDFRFHTAFHRCAPSLIYNTSIDYAIFPHHAFSRHFIPLELARKLLLSHIANFITLPHFRQTPPKRLAPAANGMLSRR